jgi:hypothetical protein
MMRFISLIDDFDDIYRQWLHGHAAPRGAYRAHFATLRFQR